MKQQLKLGSVEWLSKWGKYEVACAGTNPLTTKLVKFVYGCYYFAEGHQIPAALFPSEATGAIAKLCGKGYTVTGEPISPLNYLAPVINDQHHLEQMTKAMKLHNPLLPSDITDALAESTSQVVTNDLNSSINAELLQQPGFGSTQLINFAKGVAFLIHDLPVPESCYPGWFTKKIAVKCKNWTKADPLWLLILWAKTHVLTAQLQDLKDFGVEFDTWFSEQKLHQPEEYQMYVFNATNGAIYSSSNGPVCATCGQKKYTTVCEGCYTLVQSLGWFPKEIPFADWNAKK